MHTVVRARGARYNALRLCTHVSTTALQLGNREIPLLSNFFRPEITQKSEITLDLYCIISDLARDSYYI